VLAQRHRVLPCVCLNWDIWAKAGSAGRNTVQRPTGAPGWHGHDPTNGQDRACGVAQFLRCGLRKRSAGGAVAAI